MARTPAENKLSASIAANMRWAQCEDRTEATAPARKALEDKWLAEAGGDPVRAENLKRAHFQRLALKSTVARRSRRSQGRQ
jgi:hypothetical protein